MAQVSPRVPLAYPTLAGRIKRPLVLRIPRLLDGNFALRSKQQSMPRRARGQHTIHHIHTRLRVLRDLFRSAHPHQIARLLARKMLKSGQNNFARNLARLADAKPANGITREADVNSPLGRLAPQLPIHPPLHDAEQCLSLSLPMLYTRIVILTLS